MEKLNYFSKVLGVDSGMLEKMEAAMIRKTGRLGVLERIVDENTRIVDSTLKLLDSGDRSAHHVESVLRHTILEHEKKVLDILASVPGKSEFEKAAVIAKKLVRVPYGFFLKKDRAREILEKRPPLELLKYLKAANIQEVLEKYDVTEIFATLRFIESTEWMHETFDIAYSNFTPDDFERREIKIEVLSDVWIDVAQKFVAKKHHNVSHLKEFGVIFINPIKEDIPGKFLRDFALLFHYCYEIKFYSKLFEFYKDSPDFAEHLKSLLRGDVKDIFHSEPGDWLIVQRYLAKENPNDTRLFLPRVNPESLHWLRGERDLSFFNINEKDKKMNLKIWNNMEWVGGLFKNGEESVVSFDLEDNAMSLVSFMDGKNETFTYHQREAMWTRIFSEYAGGEEAMEKMLIDNFDKGIIKF
ncbi:MAG: hypothetical protein M1155_00590 [Patescibacteria group bacterium]|nr:hypothetical protein [Patescibacteria group bacterium]